MDTYRHKGLRRRLIALLAEKGITNSKVLSTMSLIPRHEFLDSALADQAYMDKALPITSEQTISQPYTVAFQTQLLDPKPDEVILEVGTGSGYQAAVLSLLCRKLYSIERHETLYTETTLLLKKLGYTRVITLLGDGYLGSPRHAPFDKILVTAGADTIPETLLSQLKVGGTMVIPQGEGDSKDMLHILKTGKDTYEKTSHGKFRFVPFLKGMGETI